MRYMLALLFLILSTSVCSKNIQFSDAQLKDIWTNAKNQCQQLSVAEGGGDALYQRCIAVEKDEWKSWYELFSDNSISQSKWDECGVETSFNSTLDLHAYNVCLRMIKNRHDMP